MLTFIKWLVAILLILWLIGLIFDVIGSLIHILLVVALIAGIYHLIAGRSSTAPE